MITNRNCSVFGKNDWLFMWNLYILDTIEENKTLEVLWVSVQSFFSCWLCCALQLGLIFRVGMSWGWFSPWWAFFPRSPDSRSLAAWSCVHFSPSMFLWTFLRIFSVLLFFLLFFLLFSSFLSFSIQQVRWEWIFSRCGVSPCPVFFIDFL